MRDESGRHSRISGRQVLLALGVLYLILAAGWPLLVPDNPPLTHIQLLAILVGGSGLILLGTGYWLPQTEIHPDSFATIARWCLGAISGMLVILLLVAVIAELDTIVQNVLILTALASIAGLGIGFQNAKAYTRALNAEERRREAERYSQELERYETIVETVNDGIFVVDENNHFILVNDAYTELVGYDRETLLGSHVSLVVNEDLESLANEAERDVSANTIGKETYEATLETAFGETIEVEATVARLPGQTDDSRHHVGVVRNVTERNERERALERANERLEESNERLEHFAYAASHDLQEPLRMVSSYLQLIERRTEELDEETRGFLEYATDGADRMRAMIEGLLRYARVETRGQSFKPVDLEALFADVREDLQVKMEATDATITADSLPRVEGDEEQLRQLLQNLIRNALEYSGEEPPKVYLSAKRNGTKWIVSVRDEGIGIDPEHQDQIFDVFQRLHSRDEHEGTGIGLALCERIVERHGGDIWVESEPGEGSTFSFTLPACDLDE